MTHNELSLCSSTVKFVTPVITDAQLHQAMTRILHSVGTNPHTSAHVSLATY